jgi:hypothetical protein
MQGRALEVKVSKLKLAALFVLVSILSFYYFISYVLGYGASINQQIEFTNLKVLLGLFIGASPAIVVCLILVLWSVPRVITISEESISYKIGLSKETKGILWKDIQKIKQTFWGVKFFKDREDRKLNLFWFSGKNKAMILNSIHRKAKVA